MPLERLRLVKVPEKFFGYGIHRGRLKYTMPTVEFLDAESRAWPGHVENEIMGCAEFGNPADIQRVKRTFVVDGYALCGVLPHRHIEGSTWQCRIDYYEEVVSHRQHYRYKDFQPTTRRLDFTTIAEFEQLAKTSQHIIVDAATYESLVFYFDDIKSETWIAPAEHRKKGLILKIGECLIFTDALLVRDRHWVNENPGSERPQFIVIDPQLVSTKHYDAS